MKVLSVQPLGLALMALMVSPIASAQEPPQQAQSAAIMIEASDDGSGEVIQFMSVGGVAGDGNMMMSNFTLAPAGLGGDPFNMLSSSKIQEELNLVGDQLDEFNSVREEFAKKIKEQMKPMSGGRFDPEAAKQMKETFAALEAEKKTAMEAILLPQQLKRLNQIAFQQRLKNTGTANTLRDKQIMEELGLTEEKVQKLQEKATELNQQLQEKIEKLRRELQNELLGELSKEQRDKLEELRGEEFDYTPEFPGIRSRMEKK